MIQTKDLSMVGYSGHSYVCIDAALSMGHQIIGYFEKEEKALNPYQLQFLGSETDESAVNSTDAMLFVGIGNNVVRQRICKSPHISLKLANLIHDKSYISSTVILGRGILVAAGAVINPMAIISDGVICNTNATIEHECFIGAFSHVAPGAALAGSVRLGQRVFVGANSVIKEGVTIADDVIIGAGSVVLEDIAKPGTYVGAPARMV